MMTEMQKKIYEALVELESETVLDLILDYHGTQLFTEGFLQFLVDEGALDESEI